MFVTDTQSVDKTTGKVIRSHEQLKKETQCAASWCWWNTLSTIYRFKCSI